MPWVRVGWGLNGDCKEKCTPQYRVIYVCMVTIPMQSPPISNRGWVGIYIDKRIILFHHPQISTEKCPYIGKS